MDANQVASAIADLEPGAKVRLRLADGSEVTGQLREKSGETLRLDDANDVDVAQVEGVFLDFSGLEGPE